MRRAALDIRRKARPKAKADVLAVFVDGLPSGSQPPVTKIPDWIMLCDRINPTAFRLWCILRSMQFENGPGIPPLTLDEICFLRPGINKKPTSKTRAREALDSLLEEGLLKDVSGENVPKAAPHLYLAFDEPQGAMGFSGARRKLKRYTRLWRGGA